LLLSRSLDELAERIYEETDYLKEAQETEWFYDQFNSESVNTPIVLKELTTSRVLTTTLLQGKHIDEWIMDAPPQEAKNKACKILYEFFFESLFKHSKIHADPHLGNFLFQEDGSIGVIDFGSVKALPEPALILYQELWKAALNQDYSKLIPLYKDLGAEIEGEDEDRFLKVCVIPYCEWLSFFLDQECDFENMSEQISLGKAILLKNIYEKTLQNFSTDFVLVHRTFYGLLRAFERIGGRARLNVVFS
jgi:predicted unusual protein kinase regulating ubiquinone biosynthesis (AarF/ABC1/UbiB family)